MNQINLCLIHLLSKVRTPNMMYYSTEPNFGKYIFGVMYSQVNRILLRLIELSWNSSTSCTLLLSDETALLALR